MKNKEDKKVLEIKSLSVLLDRRKLLNNISFSAQKGEFIILLGGNGCGKSSMIEILNKTSSLKYRGKIILNGSNTRTIPFSKLKQSITTVTQNTNLNLFFDLSIRENFLIYQHKINDKKEKNFDNFIKYLFDFNHKLAENPDRHVDLLSGGEKQSLVLALAMFFSCEVLLLDEHTSALDPKTASDIMTKTNDQIRNLGITAIMTTHNLDHAMLYGDRILALKNGVIYRDVNKKIIKIMNKENLMDIFS